MLTVLSDYVAVKEDEVTVAKGDTVQILQYNVNRFVVASPAQITSSSGETFSAASAELPLRFVVVTVADAIRRPSLNRISCGAPMIVT